MAHAEQHGGRPEQWGIGLALASRGGRAVAPGRGPTPPSEAILPTSNRITGTVRRVDDWLGGARSDRGGLLIPGFPREQAADLLISVDRVELHFGPGSVGLPWGLFPGGWCVVANKPGSRYEPAYGSGIAAYGDLRPSVGSVLHALPPGSRRGWANAAILRGLRGQDTVPLDVGERSTERDRASRDTVRALVVVLAASPDVRARLVDRDRIVRLAADLSSDAVEAVWPEVYGFRRQTIEIETALRSLGFEHRWGRPLPGDQLPTVPDAVERVLHWVSLNPYAAGVEIDRHRVEKLVRRLYLDVQPWPFGALTS